MGRQKERTNTIQRRCVKCRTQIEGMPPLDGFHLSPYLCNVCIRGMYPGVLDEVLLQADWICSEVRITLDGLNSIVKEQKYDKEYIRKAQVAMMYKCNKHTQTFFEVQKNVGPKKKQPLGTAVSIPVIEFNRDARKQHKETKKMDFPNFK